MTGAASASALSAASPGITTSRRAPLEPSMMVTVFCSAEPACLGADFVTGSEVLGGEVASFSPAGETLATRHFGWHAKGCFRFRGKQSGPPAKKAAPRPPFPQKLLAGPDQFAALLAGLSVDVLSAVVGALTLTLTPCKRSPAIF